MEIAQVFNMHVVVHVGMAYMELIGIGPIKIDGRGVGGQYITAYSPILVAKEVLVCLKILVQAFCIVDGGVDVVLWESSIKWKGVVVSIVLLGRLETGGIVVTHSIKAGGTVEVPISKCKRAQAGIGPQVCLIGIKVPDWVKVERFPPPDDSSIGSWVAMRGGEYSDLSDSQPESVSSFSIPQQYESVSELPMLSDDNERIDMYIHAVLHSTLI